ncbi:HEAT repeat domain-containing protein [Planctomicrobium piriforme]|uniref:HEAT repeat-containing protein n=1 Tax=Planctomicrobium piriforme TaxID=1576369 RepID=A0A1I3J4K4_9PLAN|nr:HEAT repeat domain-containing protein [Planctomicrobium piriforme]SFI55187.1 hypothetical protein SAMN05421753_11057 [Planctomicrobium piriforme]
MILTSKNSLALLALLALCLPGEAGLLDHFRKDGNCAETDNSCCTDSRPKIERPCMQIVRTYQRQFACPPVGCDGCAPGESCVPGQPMCWPCPPEGCVTSCAPGSCDGACDSELADLICQSKTACYAHQRKAAVHKLSNRYSCKCHPQVMPALVYALNDADENVRARAADAIGDQVRSNACCCAPYVVCALKLSLMDCDHLVRCQSEQALRSCGYQIVDGCCKTGCDSCTNGCVPSGTVVPPPAQPPVPAQPPMAVDAMPAAMAIPVPLQPSATAEIPKVLTNTSPASLFAPTVDELPAPSSEPQFLQPRIGAAPNTTGELR